MDNIGSPKRDGTPPVAEPLMEGLGQGLALAIASLVGLVFGTLAAGVSIGVADLTYRIKGLTFPAGSSAVWATFGGAFLYTALFGAIGSATGSLVRNQVYANVGWLAWILVVEHIATQLLPELGRWFPAAAGTSAPGAVAW